MDRKRFLLFAVVLVFAAALRAESVTPLHEGWSLESACKVQAGGDAISVAGFSAEDWLKTSVPSTVLAAQVAAGIFPDPYFGDNLRKIPGTSYPIGHNFENLPMPADSPYRCGWWYRDSFTAPAASLRKERFWLRFGGINYRADVWLNGHRIADAKTIAGAYRTYDIDVTEFLKPGKENVVAVEAFAPTEKDLGINWVDWNPCPPDKDMGLWGPVELVTSGPVTLQSPTAVTQFHEGDLNTAYVTVYAELHNASDRAVSGVVTGSAAGAHFEQRVDLAAHEERNVIFAPEQYPALQIHNPQLWWPNQMGQPHLERLTMSFSADGRQMDEQSVEFGIREITSELTANGSRVFRVNGKRILIRGGGWAPDMLLRTDKNRLQEQFRMVRDMHLNTLRLEGKLETDDFFRLADREGILVMAGWCCCDHWERWSTWTPEDLNIATASLRAQMLRLRYHPSLLVWLNGSDNPPPAEVESAYLKVESETHWPNPILSSASAKPTTVTGESGVKMTGPYDYVEPSYWYFGTHYGGALGYNTETSPGPAIPSLASRKKFLPDAEAWPPSADWSLHNGGGNFTNLKVFDAAMDAIYAKPENAADYTRMAQTMEYDSERAMFEAYGKNKYDSTGVIQWMLNNAWPSMIWHLYDYYLDAGAGYFAAKKACEPLHIQYSYDDHSVVVVNGFPQRFSGLKATMKVYNLDMTEKASAQAVLDVGPDTSRRVFMVPELNGLTPVYFVKLTLEDADRRPVSSNFYWLSTRPDTLGEPKEGSDWYYTPTKQYADFTALNTLPTVNLNVSANSERNGNEEVTWVLVENPSHSLAFFVHLKVDNSKTGEEILPVIWEDNYFSLLPGEKRWISATYDANQLRRAKPVVELDGWNIMSKTVVGR